VTDAGSTPEPIPITAIVISKDEEVGIVGCIERLAAFDEVILVDSHSTDRTAELARAAGARVVDFAWNGRYPKKKQWCLEHVTTRHDWIFLLDVDESPQPELVAELRELWRDGPPAEAAFEVELDYVFAGRMLRHGHRIVKRSIVDRRRVRFPQVDDLGAPGAGEVEGHYQPTTSGVVRRLRGRLLHDDPHPSSTWFDRHNRYSDWEAHVLRAGEQRTVADAKTRGGRLFSRAPLKPLAFFAYSYLARAGFLDGRAGFDYAIGLSMYFWQIGVKRRELERS
jgi:glycosyltransferase involved in cell wall biosynthesis